MKQIRTLVCKLQLDDAQHKHIAETMRAFAQACQYVQDTLEPTLQNKDRMHILVYRDIRTRFGLSANLAIRAIARVSANRKAAHASGSSVKQFAASSIDYDQRIFSGCIVHSMQLQGSSKPTPFRRESLTRCDRPQSAYHHDR